MMQVWSVGIVPKCQPYAQSRESERMGKDKERGGGGLGRRREDKSEDDRDKERGERGNKEGSQGDTYDIMRVGDMVREAGSVGLPGLWI